MKNKSTDLTIGTPRTVLWRFCLPLFGSIIFQQLYNIADSLIAGRDLCGFQIVYGYLCLGIAVLDFCEACDRWNTSWGRHDERVCDSHNARPYFKSCTCKDTLCTIWLPWNLGCLANRMVSRNEFVSLLL